MAQGMRRHRRDLGRERFRFGQERFGIDHAADQAPFERGGRIDHIARVEKFGRACFADDPRQDPGPAIAGDDTQLEEGDAELRAVAGDAHIGEAGKIAAKPDRRSVDRSDQRYTQRIERAQHLVDVVAVAVRYFRRCPAEGPGPFLHRLDVAARAERSSGARQDDAAHRHIGIDRVAGSSEGIAIAGRAERVHRIGSIERQRGDVVGGFNLQQGHGLGSPLRRTPNHQTAGASPPRAYPAAQARASSTPAELWRSAARTVSTICGALRPASSYCFSGASWSWKISGNRIVRTLSPASVRPSSLA